MTQPGTKIRLILVEDHPLVRDGLRTLLDGSGDIDIVAETGRGAEGLALAAELLPDMALVDIGLPDMSGIDLASRIMEHNPATRVLVLSMYSSREYVLSALRAGVCGYLLKDAPSSEILDAIRTVAQGGVYHSAAVSAALLAENASRHELTEREREVLILLAGGCSNKSVAQQLGLSVRTVETHRLNLRRKVGADNAAGLVKYALEKGWIKV
ncbi:MAG TPA: response regulator transcription factor [Rhodocyclaceae bacterium]|nr:response regulator transcription factor [Rhodocyclaceae bacterium]